MVVVAEAEAINRLLVHAGLLYACGRSRVAGLVHGGLQLLEEAVDVLEVSLRARVRQRKRVAVLSHRAVDIGASAGTVT